LKTKAQVEKVKSIEKSVVQINEYVSTLPQIFADHSENEQAHRLLQKNLKNLYDLFVSMKSEMAGVDDPMFTAKAILTCASCTKGVSNLQGYRADHVNWDGFPFKEPGKRMLKSGMGFAKMFNQS
jgi:hypothetical protein